MYTLFTTLNNYFLKNKWVLSYIIPDSFSKERYNEDVRKDYIFNNNIEKIVDFWCNQVFDGVSNDGYIVYLLSKIKYENNLIDIDIYKNKKFITSRKIPQKLFHTSYQYQINIDIDYLFALKLHEESISLWSICFTRLWFTPSKKYKILYWSKFDTWENMFMNKNNEEQWILRKYNTIKWGRKINWDRKILYDDKVAPGEKEDYIHEKIILRNRWISIFATYDKWWTFYNDIFNWITLKYRYTSDRIFNKEDIALSRMYNIKYILSLLNSKVIQFFILKRFNSRDIKSPMIRMIPIKEISEEWQGSFIEKVDTILGITKQSFYDPKNPPREQLDLEAEIDEMVYRLYGLTEDEIRVVEESLK